MAIADMIPTLPDDELESLKQNATRIEATASGAQREKAAALLPLIEAEIAERLAKKPAAKPARGRKPKAAPKVASEAVEEPA